MLVVEGEFFGPVRVVTDDGELELEGDELVDWLRARGVATDSAQQQFLVAVRASLDGGTGRASAARCARCVAGPRARRCRAPLDGRRGRSGADRAVGFVSLRLGVASALVDGRLVSGDVEIDRDAGRILAVGLAGVGPGHRRARSGGPAGQRGRLGGPARRRARCDRRCLCGARIRRRDGVLPDPVLGSGLAVPHRPGRTGRGTSARPGPGGRPAPDCSAHTSRARSWRRRVAVPTMRRTSWRPTRSCWTCCASRVTSLWSRWLPSCRAHSSWSADSPSWTSSSPWDTPTRRRRRSVDAVDAGARLLGHCWNAHRPMTARDPGPAGVALSDERLTVGVIGDLVHVAPEVLGLTLAAATGRVAISTDRVVDGAERRPDGGPAGGAATPAACLANLIGLGVGLECRRGRLRWRPASAARPGGRCGCDPATPRMSWCSTKRGRRREPWSGGTRCGRVRLDRPVGRGNTATP